MEASNEGYLAPRTAQTRVALACSAHRSRRRGAGSSAAATNVPRAAHHGDGGCRRRPGLRVSLFHHVDPAGVAQPREPDWAPQEMARRGGRSHRNTSRERPPHPRLQLRLRPIGLALRGAASPPLQGGDWRLELIALPQKIRESLLSSR